MTDPYTESTRRQRSRMPAFAKVVLVAGGLFAVAIVALAVFGIALARKMADELLEIREPLFAAVEMDGAAAEALAEMAEAFIGEEVRITQASLAEGALTLRHDGQGANIRIDLSGLKDRGSSAEAGLGEYAKRIPNWVPVPPDASVRKHLFSVETDKATLGGVVLGSRSDGRSVYDWYRERLPRLGLGISKSQTRWDVARKRGVIRARSEGLVRDRELFAMVADQGERGSSIVLMHKVAR